MQYSKEEVLQRRKDMALLTQQGYSIPKIAERYGISRQAVSQLLQKAAKDGHKVVLRSCGGRKSTNENYVYRPTRKETGFTKTCESCGASFNTKSSFRKTCSTACRRRLLHKSILLAKGTLGNWSRYEQVQLVCNNCGKTFERSKYRDSISKIGCGTKNSYCGRECFHEKSKINIADAVVKSYAGNKWPSLEQYHKTLEKIGDS